MRSCRATSRTGTVATRFCRLAGQVRLADGQTRAGRRSCMVLATSSKVRESGSRLASPLFQVGQLLADSPCGFGNRGQGVVGVGKELAELVQLGRGPLVHQVLPVFRRN